jgi:hypothetical protein
MTAGTIVAASIVARSGDLGVDDGPAIPARGPAAESTGAIYLPGIPGLGSTGAAHQGLVSRDSIPVETPPAILSPAPNSEDRVSNLIASRAGDNSAPKSAQARQRPNTGTSEGSPRSARTSTQEARVDQGHPDAPSSEPSAGPSRSKSSQSEKFKKENKDHEESWTGDGDDADDDEGNDSGNGNGEGEGESGEGD